MTQTAVDFSPTLQVVTWLLLALLSLVLFFRLLTRFFIKSDRYIGYDGLFILFAFVFAVGESVTEIIPPGAIYGRDIGSISPTQLQSGIKDGYARDILFLLSLGFAKLSVTSGLMILSPRRPTQLVIKTTTLTIAVWTVSSVLIAALQCGAQGPWASKAKQCIDIVAFWESVSIISLLLDITLVAIPAFIVFPLHMSLKMRLVVICFYSARLLCIVPTIFQLIYTPRLADDNFIWSGFAFYLSMQLVQFTNISTACIIYFWPFLRSLQTGLIFHNKDGLKLQYSLTKMRKLGSKDSGNSALALNQAARDRNDYVEITTEISAA
ncbi:hypothetical protein F5B22DRAFT_144125 [Xylaria bambusicola]|uniref:uncharacterized protein n=1 Tax=Xylaria bambusicola TaxID=326684 RepID=UPI0020078664|nr:uncharacterized protein F5B22DRAFT_144125 [Xylaria bambusicola]KAI0517030.1 hypothetical protein F5B22DRAFT_144125 [Xylaria bambusicola]